MGAVVGAVFVLGVPAIFGDTTVAGLLPSGIGLLVLVVAFPGGLVELGTRVGARARRALGRAAGRFSAAGGRRSSARRAVPAPPAAAAAGSAPAATTAPAPRARRSRSPALVGSRGPAPLEVSGLTVRFGGRVALDDVALSVGAGEVLGLIGANGAGKSTLLDVVSGFITPDAGRVVVAGRDLSRLSPAQRARAGIGRVLQDARLFDDLSLSEAVMVGASAADGDRERRAAEARWIFWGLRPYAGCPVPASVHRDPAPGRAGVRDRR